MITVPLQSQVDRWYERLAPRAREIGVRCVRAHGALRFRQRQHLLQALQGGAVDVLLASVEYLRNIETGGEAASVGPRLRPSLLLAECEPTIEENALDGVAQALGNPLQGYFQGGPTRSCASTCGWWIGVAYRIGTLHSSPRARRKRFSTRVDGPQR
ncbi:MAG: hypothetical protein AUI83_22490 [Armatimonadetes bacterium 13_1_40CM_3_65_7]|nr:MAG: hypothetical protein AUI83_22490 [Armatimonadetes bacterium 13_1_40CM_3_65_7]